MTQAPNKVPTAIKQAIRDKYTRQGGYPLFLITSDGAALCIECGKKEYRNIVWSIRHNVSDGWKVEAADINWENAELYCDHCDKQIESAYGEE